ncbi:MAG: ribosome biogenesis GTPase Der [Cryobacterium sp.]|nr:ribosome biogenesis GTPase Der [Oligoflexia bacterium]
MIIPFAPKMNAPRVVIVGRPNVGKSTLFNRLFGRRRALVHDVSGVTRDRLEEQVEWWVLGERYILNIIDTGGLGGDRFAEEIKFQVDTALARADVVVALFDGQAGYTPADQEVIQKMVRSGLKKGEIKLIAAVNKVDDSVHEDFVNEFYATGIADIIGISAEHNRGVETLQEKIIEALTAAGKISPESSEMAEDRVPRVAIIGRPNVGKSTFVNAVMGEIRMITSPVAGTTVDSIDSLCAINGKAVVLIDTAGIRRKSKTEQGVEVLSVVQSRKAIERANVAILMLNSEEGTSDQDEKIAGLIEETGCSVILVMNKWDTTRGKKDFSKDKAVEQIRHDFGFLRYAPVMFVSAKEGTGFKDLGDLIYDILEQRKLKISTREFTEWVRAEAEIHNPYNVKFYMCHQVSRHPPTFVCHVSNPDKVHFSLHRHLMNAIREKWGFMGTPIRMLFQEGKSRKGPKQNKFPTTSTGRKNPNYVGKEGFTEQGSSSAMEYIVDPDLESGMSDDYELISEENGSHDGEE